MKLADIESLTKEEVEAFLRSKGKLVKGMKDKKIVKKGLARLDQQEKLVPHTFTCELCGNTYVKDFKVMCRMHKGHDVYIGDVKLLMEGCDKCQEYFEKMPADKAIATLLAHIRGTIRKA